jgi:sugar lactone lactonase YvrE
VNSDRKRSALLLPVVVSLLGSMAFVHSASADSVGLGAVTMAGKELARIQTGAIYPEGIEYNPATGKFLLGSLREGSVYAVANDGRSELLVGDERLVTVLGIRVDAKRNRLLVAASDLGVSVRRSAPGPNKFAALGIYELSTGKPLHFVDLGALRPAGENHLANDLAVDDEGNAYVTDSLAPVIYRVDVNGNASVLLDNKEMFSGEGVNLNGIVFHPKGYLIVVKKNDGALFKVPLKNPGQFSKIQTSQKLVAGDGLVLANAENLIVIANRIGSTVSNTVYALSSTDDWNSAQVGGEFKFANDDYPTTGAVKDGKIFVSESRLYRLLGNPAAEKDAGYPQKAILQQVGTIGR